MVTATRATVDSQSVQISRYYNVFVDRLTNLGTYYDLFSLDVLSRTGSMISVFGLILLMIILSIKKNVERTHKRMIFYPVILFVSLIFIYILTEIVAPASSDFYLIPGYVKANAQQFLLMWSFSIVAVVIYTIFYVIPTNKRKTIIFVTGYLVVCLGLSSLMSLNVVNRRARKNYAGSMGVATENDKIVMKKTEDLFKAYKDEHKALTYENIPKILVPNFIVKTDKEDWLFVLSGARILPMYDTFPVAFYYFQGDAKSYSFNNYISNVKNKFNVEWLKSKNIKYLYVPSDGPDDTIDPAFSKICINVVYQSGKAKLIQIW